MTAYVGAVLLLLSASASALSATSAFAPRAALPICRRADQPRAGAARMVSAKEVFGQYFEASPPVQKSLQTLPPPVAKGAMAGLVAITGVAGFALTPSRRIAVNTVGGALAASVGNIARKRLTDERQKAAMPAVAALLAEGLPKAEGMTAASESLAAIAVEFDVPKKQFEGQLAELYLAFLNACLTAHEVQTAELSDLLRLQTLLRLSAAQTGTQVYAAARQLYSRHRAYLEDTEPNDSKKLLQKFVFLAERILSRDESPEGYRYESLRLQKLFNLTTGQWRSMAEEAAVPFYEKALTSAVLEAKPVTAPQLAAVRDSLGISTTCADNMHADIFSKAAAEMLADGALAAADKERLSSVVTLLGMAPAAMSRTLQSLTSPLYTASFEEVLAELEALDADADASFCAQKSAGLAQRQDELLLEAADAHAIEAEAMRTTARGVLEGAVKLLRAQNVPQGLGEVQRLDAFCARAAAFMVEVEHAQGPPEAALSSLFGGLKSGEMKQSEVLSLYRVLLLHYLEDFKVDEVEAASLARLRAVLGLSDVESTSIYQAAAGPLFRTAVQKAVNAELGEAQKEELQTSLANLALPPEATLAVSAEVYGEKLRAFAGDSKIMDEEQVAQLAQLRDFLGLEMSDVYEMHEAECSGAYRNSVREVMGVSGIIPDEYWDGLDKLRERLGLSEETAQQLFSVEVTVKMKEFGTKAVDAMTAKMESQQQPDKTDDKGSINIEAPALSTEVLNLVDFAVAAKVIMVKEGAGKEFDACGANLRNEFEERTLKELYKQFLIEAFSGSNAATNQRLFDSLNRVALVLGLKSDEVAMIHNGVGSHIYRTYISKALKKGPLGQEETNFLSSIKEVLSMEQAKCDELVREQQTQRVSILIEQMFEKSQVIAEDVRKMRDEADLYEVDLLKDLQLGTFKRERLFLCELEDLVESGELKADDMSALIEVAEPLHISEEDAQRMLETSVQKRTAAGVLQAASSLRQNSPDGARAELERMLQFAALLPGTVADAKAVSAGERSELYMLYQAGQLAAGTVNVEGTAKLELLKSVMGLAVAASAPAS